MNTSIEAFMIRTYRKYRPDTLAEYIDKTRKYLLLLQQIHPLFRQLAILGKEDFIEIAEDLEGLEELLTEAAYDPKYQRHYVNTNSNGTLALDSLSAVGFSASFSSYDKKSGTSIPREQGGIKLRITGGALSAQLGSSISLLLPLDQYGDFHEYEFAKRLFIASLDTFEATKGDMISHEFIAATREDDDYLTVGWLTYLRFPPLPECLPDDIDHEVLPGGGTLISTTRERCSVENPEHVASAKHIRSVLDELGLVKSEYALHGLPPDEEGWGYEDQISGAPSGRKYVIECVYFDGYDANRDVLLYAKLFKKLRKRLKPTWVLDRMDKFVIAEAHRQLRAVNRAAIKSGKSTPIEWHIGIEEKAEAVRLLLDEFTDISEAQLKIVYTPYLSHKA